MARDIRITPSILNANFDNLDSEIAKIAAVSDYIHLDVMDNIFVPNFTFDFDTAASIIGRCPIGVDAHLMVSAVDLIAPEYAAAGAASVTIHVEACSDIRGTLKSIKEQGARAAIALKPASKIEEYSEYLDLVDMVLIMTVEPGFGGQKFMVEMMEKVSATKRLLGSRQVWLQVDGGISLSTIDIARRAGADTFVAGSAVFTAEDPAEMVKQLREEALSE